MNQHIVKKTENRLRIDRLVSELLPEVSRSFLSKSMHDFVLVDGKKVKQSYKVKVGQEIEIHFENLRTKYEEELKKGDSESKIIPQKGELDIVYEDKDFLILNKKAGFVVHPSIGHEEETLANYVKQYLIEKGSYDYGLKRAGIVHRLDMPVSGLIAFAKNRKAQKHLSAQFESHNVLKIYFASYEIVEDKKLFNDFKTIDSIYKLIDEYKNDQSLDLENWYEVGGSMKRDPANRKRMLFQRGVYDERSRYAQSYLLPLSECKMCVLIKTGRMHQIRATLRSLGIVLKGDKLYGWKRECSEEIGLNSVVLGFVDMNGEKKVFNLLDAFDG